MTEKYVPQDIEPQWQQKWEKDRLYRAVIDDGATPFFYLTMLPYTSGDMHLGHWYAMVPSDTQARWRRMQGYNVMFPIGFDAFGLPAENAAIERRIHPKEWTYGNVKRMRRQLRSMGAMWDWEREAISADPKYYRWTQWFFLQLFKHGLAYRAEAPVDFCPQCNTTLAREQVWGEDRHCERCGTPVIKKDLEQWFFRITDYAEELLDHSKIEWPERVETMQKNWIGRSEGADVIFKSEQDDDIIVFTTRPDTLWGATFMVLAPEHQLVDKLTIPDQREAVDFYVSQAARQSEIDRTALDKEKTGVFIGAYAINPVNGERVPIWIADYVLMTYGTGAIMAVPAHDERDFEFALTFGLPIVPVIDRLDGVAKSLIRPDTTDDGFANALTEAGISFDRQDGALYVTLERGQVDDYIAVARAHLRPGCWTEVVGARWEFVFNDGVWSFDSIAADRQILRRCQDLEPAVKDVGTVMELLYATPFYRDVLLHVDYATMINSAQFTGTPGDVAVSKVIEWLDEKRIGEGKVRYRLHDWLISRQRYWGAPIPIIYCPECGIVPVPEDDLPVLLPDDVEFMPTGESPLKFHEGFLHTTCPQCSEPALRETDTMDTFMCSSWYQYRYLSPDYDEGPWDPEEGRYWLPVDQYTGGIEHATMHLMYTRFFTKALRDIGIVDFDEPMKRLYNQGMVLGEDGEKMSKSRGNVIAPDELVKAFGADTVRTYLMFFARWEQGGPWDSQGIKGPRRFMEDVWNLVVDRSKVLDDESVPTDDEQRALRRKTHQTIRKVTEDLGDFGFNTAVAALMELRNMLQDAKKTALYRTQAWDEAIETLLLLLCPIAPHITEELWSHLGKSYSIHQQAWPKWDEAVAAEEMLTLVVQINGKLRDRIQVPAGITEAEAKELALGSDNVRRYVGDKLPRKMIYVPGKLINIVA